MTGDPALAPTLAQLTTLRLGGPAAELVVAEDEATLVAAVSEADEAGTPLLVVGGGSNLVVADAGFSGRVVLVRTRGVQVESDLCGGAYVEVAAGEPWDDLVAQAVERGWTGIEALAGIPGTTGATPVQNVGAYGQEVSQTLARVRTWDRQRGVVRTFAAADCGFGYRSSRFKREPGRFVVLAVVFQLGVGSLGAPVRYAELAAALGVQVGGRAPARVVRETVLSLRASKAMVLDADDHDTWSTGSFFTNPIVAQDVVPDGAPSWPVGHGRDGEPIAKTSAAWLIEHAGFAKGHGHDPVRLSTRHTLAITNRGGATTAQLLDLAREVRDGVHDRFGIVLEPEPVLVGCAL